MCWASSQHWCSNSQHPTTGIGKREETPAVNQGKPVSFSAARRSRRPRWARWMPNSPVILDELLVELPLMSLELVFTSLNGNSRLGIRDAKDILEHTWEAKSDPCPRQQSLHRPLLFLRRTSPNRTMRAGTVHTDVGEPQVSGVRPARSSSIMYLTL